MASSSSPTSPDAGNSLPDAEDEREVRARSLLVDRVAELERENERLEATNADLERENERLARCLRRRRRERQDVIDRYERQLRERTAALERERDGTAASAAESAMGVRERVADAVLALAERFVERCPGLGRSGRW